MGRLFVYDENMTDERAKITVAKMAAVSDIVASEKAFIQYSTAGQLTVLAGAVIAVGDAIFRTEETTLSAANLDGASSFAHGKDYYIYLCDNGKDSSNEVYLISENSTFPDGVEWDDTNTRKIGGFHYGFVRNVDEYGREVNTSGRKSSIRKLKQDVKAYELGELPPEEFNRKYESRKGHLGHADTYHIAKAVEYELLFYEWERLEATA